MHIYRGIFLSIHIPPEVSIYVLSTFVLLACSFAKRVARAFYQV